MFDSRLADRRVFVISRHRILNGSSDFNGIVTTGIAPEYFADYYARLPQQPDSIFALVREDGAMLARFPPTQRLVAPAPADDFCSRRSDPLLNKGQRYRGFSLRTGSNE